MSSGNPPDQSSSRFLAQHPTLYTSTLSFASCLQNLIQELNSKRDILIALLQALCALPSFRNIVFDQDLSNIGLTSEEIKHVQNNENHDNRTTNPRSSFKEDPMSLADRLLDNAGESHRKTRVRETLGELFRQRTEILINRAKSITPATQTSTSNLPSTPVISPTQVRESKSPIPLKSTSSRPQPPPTHVPPPTPQRNTRNLSPTRVSASSPLFSVHNNSTDHSVTVSPPASSPHLPISSTLNRSLNKSTQMRGQSSLSREEVDEPPKTNGEKIEPLTLKGVALFNTKPLKGIEYLRETGVLSSNNPKELAQFLISTPNISPVKLGEYLGEPDLQPVLLAFTEQLDLSGLDFDFALRRFLSKFRLPGEAQKIDRMMETFAQRFYSQNSSGVFANADAAYVLAFSLIMLNTDAHNPSIKKQDKMTKQQFIKNNSGINNGRNIDQTYLELLYDHIVRDQIQLPESVTLFSNAEKKGWLTKQGGKIKTWKRRWFVLNRNCLFYFKTEMDSEPCGIIPLENLVVSHRKSKKSKEKEKDAKRRWKFRIGPSVSGEEIKSCKMEDGVVVKGNHSEYIISAHSQEEMDDWMNALKNHMHKDPFFDLVEHKKLSLRQQSGSSVTIISAPRGLVSMPSQIYSPSSSTSSTSASGSHIQHTKSTFATLSRSSSFNGIFPSTLSPSEPPLSMTSPRQRPPQLPQQGQQQGVTEKKDIDREKTAGAVPSPSVLRKKLEDRWKKLGSPSMSSLDLLPHRSEAERLDS